LEVKFVKPTEDHILDLGQNMREDDQQECAAAGHLDPHAAVRASIDASAECWACTVDGRVLAIFGLTVQAALERKASLWLLTSTLVDRKPKLFVSLARKALASMRRAWPILSVGIDAHHATALRFASRFGFSPGWTYAHPDTGEPFRLHTMGD